MCTCERTHNEADGHIARRVIGSIKLDRTTDFTDQEIKALKTTRRVKIVLNWITAFGYGNPNHWSLQLIKARIHIRWHQYLDLTTYVHGRTEPGRVGFYQNAWYSYIWKDPKGSSEITEGVREQEDQFSWDGDEHLPMGRRYGGRLSASYLDL
jgi:hypothetical protein